jgi:hypothetical protein
MARYWTIVFHALVALSAAAAPVGQGSFGVAKPIRLVGVHWYWDGGTTSFVLVDATGKAFKGGFDGRIRLADSPPRGCYVGNDYPTDAGVRFLPTGGSEERELVDLLATVLSDSLGDEFESLCPPGSTAPPGHGSSAKSGSIPVLNYEFWSLICSVTSRQRTFDGLD